MTYLVEQRLDLLAPLALADLASIRHLEELRSDFNQPFGLNCRHGMAVFASSKDQFVVHEPLRWAIEQSGRRVNIDGSAFDKSLVSFLWILFGGVSEEPTADCYPHTVVVATR